MEKNIVGVKFQDSGKVYYFESDGFSLKNGETVIVSTSNGENIGKVVLEVKNFPLKDDSNLGTVIRKATADDIKQREYLNVKSEEAKAIFYQRANERGMEMKLIDAQYSFDGTKVVFYFTADGRVDFRDLVKDLAGYFHARIELRQIGVRDEAKLYESIGLCGRKCCCTTWLKDFVPVSIKMAKEQNLSLNSTKISGVCGRLLCCLNYEESYYEELSKRMPKIGAQVKTPNGLGTVYKLKTLEESVLVKIKNERDETEIKCFTLEELDQAAEESLEEKVPENTKEETHSVIPKEVIESKIRETEAEREHHKDTKTQVKPSQNKKAKKKAIPVSHSGKLKPNSRKVSHIQKKRTFKNNFKKTKNFRQSAKKMNKKNIIKRTPTKPKLNKLSK